MAFQSISSGFVNTNISLALDPTGQYQHCSLHYPRVAIVGQRLYLDGGETRMMIGDDGENAFWEVNARMLAMDLTQPFNYSHYTITSASHPYDIPALAGGVAYVPSDVSDTKFYAFAGNYPSTNISAISYTPPPQNFDQVGLLWSYDTRSGLWATEYGAGVVTGLQGGSAATNPFLNEAYYLGGIQDNWVIKNSGGFFVEGMVALNMNRTDRSWRNESVPGLSTFGGFMEYLPVGDQGALIAFGGQGYQAGVLGGSPSVGLDMSLIQVYDAAERTWKTQKASGVPGSETIIPATRILGCSVMVPAPDNSSYNIYVFGGEVQIGGPRVKDIWVLTLPNFTWIKLANDRVGSVGSTCRRIANQALLFGSAAASETECQAFFSIFDLTSLEWTNSYNPSAAAYLVPPAISSVIGGNLTGGATKLSPNQIAGPWMDSLEELFSRTPWGPANFSSRLTRNGDISAGNPTSATSTNLSGSPSSSSTTTPPSSGKEHVPLSVGQVAGITVSAVAAILVLIGGVMLWHWILRKKDKAEENPRPSPPNDPVKDPLMGWKYELPADQHCAQSLAPRNLDDIPTDREALPLDQPSEMIAQDILSEGQSSIIARESAEGSAAGYVTASEICIGSGPETHLSGDVRS
ncbi:hypothetical protein LTR84_011010 [Exophiala bonariae]|uniref:Kelch repeat protein n=1 Tax=Exophiala bonariae TaxID=1690606 RepID=A0AAV9NIB8_9EURO|nr:hypothetical protein LTR84_011010 [Exophiala bonariae]